MAAAARAGISLQMGAVQIASISSLDEWDDMRRQILDTPGIDDVRIGTRARRTPRTFPCAIPAAGPPSRRRSRSRGSDLFGEWRRPGHLGPDIELIVPSFNPSGRACTFTQCLTDSAQQGRDCDMVRDLQEETSGKS